MSCLLLADRFLPLAHALHLDLATGDRAWLRLEPAIPVAEGLRWSERCAALTSIWHPGVAECLDYGSIGTSQRFEAYRVNHLLPHGADSLFDSRSARDRIEAFLAGCGIAPGPHSIEGTDAAGRWLVVPGEFDVSEGPDGGRRSPPGSSGAGDSGATSGVHVRVSDGSIGVRLVHRAAYDALRERLSAEPPTGISVTDVEARAGAGGRTLLRYCAREARRLGWVTLATPALRWIEERRERLGHVAWDEIVAGRHVLVLHDGRHSTLGLDHELAGIVLRLGTRVPRPHRLIQLVLRPRAADALTLEPLTPLALTSMFVLAGERRRVEKRIQSAVTASRGLPGHCIDAVLRHCAPTPRVPDAVSRAHIVHDKRTAFGVKEEESTAQPVVRQAGGGRLRGILGRVASPGIAPATTALRTLVSGRPSADSGVWRTISDSERLASAGRHAAADRMLRQARAAQVRRGHDREGGDLALACGRLHMDRGHIRPALASFSDALTLYERAAATAQMAVTSAWLGRAHLDALDTDESEACLRAAVAAAVLANSPAACAWARLSLARTLWWLGRSDEARGVLLSITAIDTGERDCRAAPDARRVALACAALGVRINCALGAPQMAAASVSAAHEHAAVLGTPVSMCLAHLARAHWCNVLGDVTGLNESVTCGLILARAARRPLDALRFRMLRCHRRDGERSRTDRAPDVRALQRAITRGLPDLLAVRARLALAACAGPHALEAVRGSSRSRGATIRVALPALAADPCEQPRTAMIDDLIEVLRICQEGEDTRQALLEVARVIQAKTRADSIVFVAAARRPLTVAWPEGGRQHIEAASRTIASGVAFPAARVGDATEAAWPVRCAGSVIGAVACRWIGPPPVDPERVGSLLSAVAAAVAPAFRVLLDHADAPALPGIESELLGVSGAVEDVRRAVARAADAPYPVLVQAESGAGKELVAHAIHRASARRSRPFCALNCAALPDELIEAELFGHAKGAFTGAIAERRGLFEEADGGVLFLDEVGELSPRAQAKLLRVIQEGEIRRVGETVPRRIDVRLVAATNRLLDQEVEAGRFRRDLWYRLDVIRIVVPPLRERPEDVPILAAGFWRRATERVGSRALLSDATLAALARYDWPGNVRELQNVLAALAVSSPRRGMVGPSALPATLAQVAAAPRGGATLEQARRLFETRFVRAALARAGGHRGRAAAELGVTRQGLAKLMGRLGVETPEACGPAVIGSADAGVGG